MSTHNEVPRRFITFTEAADYLAVSADTVRRWVAEGRLPGYRIGDRSVRVKLTDVEALIERIPTVKA